MHLYFMNYLRALSGRPWNYSQANFTVAARSCLKRIQFQDRLRHLGATDFKARDKIRALTVFKTLALSDIYTQAFSRLYFAALNGLSACSQLNWPIPKRQPENGWKMECETYFGT